MENGEFKIVFINQLNMVKDQKRENKKWSCEGGETIRTARMRRKRSVIQEKEMDNCVDHQTLVAVACVPSLFLQGSH